MKKLILIPTALITGLLPVISLVGCGDEPGPEPKDLEKYKVTEQEMKDAISLKDILFLQTQYTEETGQGQTDVTINEEFSTSVYHIVKEQKSPELYDELYVVHGDDDSYTGYVRDDPTTETWYDVPATEGDFQTAEKVGNQLYGIYQAYVSCGFEFTFNEIDKCYSDSLSTLSSTTEIKYYFENKKMVKMEQITTNGSESEKKTTTFAYEQITPTPPSPYIFNLTEFSESTDPDGFQFYCEGVDLSPGITYTVNIDTEPHASKIISATGWEFGILDDVGGTPSSDIVTASVVIDSTPQTPVEQTSGHPGENEFTIRSFGGMAAHLEGGTVLNGSHKITIYFTVNDEIEAKDLVFIIV